MFSKVIDFVEMTIPLEIERIEISHNSTVLNYSGVVIDAPGSVWGTLEFKEPIDFRNLLKKSLPDVIDSSMHVEIRDTIFDQFL